LMPLTQCCARRSLSKVGPDPTLSDKSNADFYT
jgi:hypothetical protein